MSVAKRILLVSNGFYPEISPRSYRATELAKEFCRLGHHVTVITKNRDYGYHDFLKENSLALKMWPKTILPQITDFKKNPFNILSRILSRILLTLFEYPGIEDMFRVRRMLRTESGYDLMISFAVPYPVHWGVAWARTGNHRISEVWVADCGDPYMGDVLDTFRKPFYFGFLEKWFCRKSDYISIPVEGARSGYYPEFHNKIRIIPQGYEFNQEEHKGVDPVNLVPSFAYAGGFLPGIRDPEPLLNYLCSLNIPFKFYVFTNNPDLVIKYQEVLKDKLMVSGYIPRKELLKELARMDFLINFDNNTSLNSPSKLIDYAIIGRPVLNIRKEFRHDDVISFLKRDYSMKLALPEPGQYHISRVASQFLRLLINE
jgi:hypothetical protein